MSKSSTANPPFAGPTDSAHWSEIPCAEGWWFDADSECWVEIASADLSTAIVDITWRSLWYGPIIIPKKPTLACPGCGRLFDEEQVHQCRVCGDECCTACSDTTARHDVVCDGCLDGGYDDGWTQGRVIIS